VKDNNVSSQKTDKGVHIMSIKQKIDGLSDRLYKDAFKRKEHLAKKKNDLFS